MHWLPVTRDQITKCNYFKNKKQKPPNTSELVNLIHHYARAAQHRITSNCVTYAMAPNSHQQTAHTASHKITVYTLPACILTYMPCPAVPYWVHGCTSQTTWPQQNFDLLISSCPRKEGVEQGHSRTNQRVSGRKLCKHQALESQMIG